MDEDAIRGMLNEREGVFPGCSGLSEYHRMYVYPHCCSRVVNRSCGNGRILFVSGDSQMIPIVPVFCCYFSEVWYFDNRDGGRYIGKLDGVGVTEVLFCVGFNEWGKYAEGNLR